MKSKLYLLGALSALLLAQAPVRADHNGSWGSGGANMPNGNHKACIEETDAYFHDLAPYGEGADSVNRCLEEGALVGGAGEDGDSQPFEELTARLDPLPDIQGRGQAKYKMFDEDASFERVFIVTARLRLIKGNGTAANEVLGLAAANAETASVTAYLARETETDELTDYATCALVFDGFLVDDLGVAYYAAYRLELKESAGVLAEAVGVCVDTSAAEAIPVVELYDRIDIGVSTDAVPEEVRPVLMGGF